VYLEIMEMILIAATSRNIGRIFSIFPTGIDAYEIKIGIEDIGLVNPKRFDKIAETGNPIRSICSYHQFTHTIYALSA
jgi:hypothetical protein